MWKIAIANCKCSYPPNLADKWANEETNLLQNKYRYRLTIGIFSVRDRKCYLMQTNLINGWRPGKYAIAQLCSAWQNGCTSIKGTYPTDFICFSENFIYLSQLRVTTSQIYFFNAFLPVSCIIIAGKKMCRSCFITTKIAAFPE